MILTPVCRTSKPRSGDLDALERIARRRAEIEAVRPADGGGAEARAFLLALLERMEEGVCTNGYGSAPVVAGWRCLAAFESFGADGERENGGRRPASRRPASRRRPKANPTDDGGTRDDPANDE